MVRARRPYDLMLFLTLRCRCAREEANIFLVIPFGLLTKEVIHENSAKLACTWGGLHAGHAKVYPDVVNNQTLLNRF